ncbi:MAG: sodium/solute symporter [Verrucomicrobia bacterium]|nr:sodium/solute symporter [Verrucomicrobiota bacterium]
MHPNLILAAAAANGSSAIHLTGIDWAIVALYALIIVTVGLLVTRKPKNSEAYFLAGRSLRWPMIGASLFAANISAEHFVALAGSGFAVGIAIGAWEWSAVFCLAPLILIFLPFYIRNKIYTVPEFLERRFGPSVRMTFSLFMIVLSVLAKVSISLWAASLVMMPVFGLDNGLDLFGIHFGGQTVLIWGIGLMTAIYTMKGGLKAVVVTDSLQSTVLLVAGFILLWKGMEAVGGWDGMKAGLDIAQAKTGRDYLNMIQPATDESVPWFGMMTATVLVGSFYWSMDQVLVQRVFAAKSLNEGRLGATFCGFLKLTTPFILVMPGIIALALYHQGKLAMPLDTAGKVINDTAYPTMLGNLMPHGLLGLTVAGIAAALMGHISATYNSISTLVTRDIYLKFRPEADSATQIRVGRWAVLTVFILGAAWAPLIGKAKSMFDYLQAVQSYMMIPFAAIFFLGVFWKRVTTAGVLACVACSAVVSSVFMWNSAQMQTGAASFIPYMDNPYLRPFTHSAMVAGAISVLVLVGVSLFTKRSSDEQLAKTTIQGATFAEADEQMAWYANYRLWLGLAIASSLSLWVWFSI